ncbi:GNAT family N-acetyltransferase [Kribbella deserti]|uniref:GNAT family N-acetyltransferase n=1 Tax=Kribbella deserti TaxID=1926257 RepID=A0ABV6QME6_9ACTN
MSLPLVVEADGLMLRPWRPDDVPVMVSLFNTEEIDRWTPLAHPFDQAAAEAYLERALDGVASGTYQLAITEAGVEPVGEVLLFPRGVKVQLTVR